MPKGGRARIVTFLPNFRVDGYQWAYVDYNNGQYYGYAQLDLKNNQLIMHDTNAIDLYFETINESVDIMNTITGTIVKGTIPVNKAVKINFLTTSKATDNYQWANVTYNGVTGYVKLDVQSVSNINFTSTSDSAV